MQKWFTCCSCGISCLEDEVEEVVDFEGKFDFMCHRCFDEHIGSEHRDYTVDESDDEND